MAHLLHAAFHALAVPLPHVLVQRQVDDGHVGRDERPHIVALAHLNLLAGQDDGYFGVMGTHHAHGFGPAHAVGNYVAGIFFFCAPATSDVLLTPFLYFLYIL